MKNLLKLLIMALLVTCASYAQETIPDKQLMLGIVNVTSVSNHTFTISSVGTVWTYNSVNYVQGGVAYSQLQTTGVIGLSNNNWPGYNFDWLNGSPHWSLGVYKLTNTAGPGKYIYIDARDSKYPSVQYNPDIFIYFDSSSQQYKQRTSNATISFEQGSLVSVAELKGETRETSGLQNYWSNALVAVPSVVGSSPRFIWGRIPNYSPTGYKIYWRLGGTGLFSLLTTLGANTYEFTHEDILLGGGDLAEYKVQAFNSNSVSEYSNTVSINVSGFYKTQFGKNDVTPLSVSLFPAYPNPFIPETNISFVLPKAGFTSLKVFNILGKEVSTIINESMPSGSHNVKFEGRNLPSGVYIYRLYSNGATLSRTMILNK